MTVLRCGGGCGSELETSDPMNHRAAYLCPRCLTAESERIGKLWPQPTDPTPDHTDGVQS